MILSIHAVVWRDKNGSLGGSIYVGLHAKIDENMPKIETTHSFANGVTPALFVYL